MANLKINLVINGVDYSQKSEDRPYCLPVEEFGTKIYVDEKTWKMCLNIIQNERREHDNLTRCEIIGKSGKCIVCRHKCPEECPFRFDPDDPELSKNSSDAIFEALQFRNAVSLDQLYEDYEYEAAAPEDDEAKAILEERKEKMWSQIHSLTEHEQKVIDLWSKGKTEREMAEVIGVSKTAIHKQINRILDKLREKCRGF